MLISMIYRLVAINCVEVCGDIFNLSFSFLLSASIALYSPSTRLMSIQEILTYLGHVQHFWSSLVNWDPRAMKIIG